MLIYRGVTKIGNWNEEDVAQIRQGLTLHKLGAKVLQSRMLEEWAMPPSLKSYPDKDDPTYTECSIFISCIEAIEYFLKDTPFFWNPPIQFAVVKDTVYILEDKYHSHSERNVLVETIRKFIKNYPLKYVYSFRELGG